MFFGGLVQELARLREAAVQGLGSLQAEHAKLEEEIRWAQERHQTVGASNQLRVWFRFPEDSVSRILAGSRLARSS